MNCLEAQNLLQQRLDGRPIDRDALGDHLARCPECATLHAAAGRLLDGLRLLVPPQPPAGMRDQVVARVLADQHARRRRVRVLTTVAMAASLLLAALAGYYWLQPPPVPPPEQPSPVVKAPETPAPSLRDSVAEAGSAVVNLTRRKADETVSQSRMLWPAVTPPAVDDPSALGQPLDPPTRSLREASQNVSAGLEPVTSSARRAFDLFLREIPAMGADDKPGF